MLPIARHPIENKGNYSFQAIGLSYKSTHNSSVRGIVLCKHKVESAVSVIEENETAVLLLSSVIACCGYQWYSGWHTKIFMRPKKIFSSQMFLRLFKRNISLYLVTIMT